MLTPATVPTMYFVGVTTAQSSIMKVFPRWAEVLGIDAVMRGIDLPIHAPADEYRRVVRFMKDDPLSRGALVTTHKLDLLMAARDLFDFLDPYADLLSEVSSISKRDEKLCGHAKDPITSGLALEAFIPPNWWTQHRNAEALLIGAGGSSLAISIYLLDKRHGANRPAKLVVTNRSQPRLDHMKAIQEKIAAGIPIEYRYCPTFEENDAAVASMPPCSLVVNATGLGKDAPGSPLTDAAVFPENALAWEFNYRGDLKFLHQSLAQQSRRNLRVEDGWIYFIHGWSQVIAEVFDITLTPEIVAELSRVASDLRPAR
ncbi:MAG: shikimate dehydrogenase family protein [Thermoguttaceae bacterium]